MAAPVDAARTTTTDSTAQTAHTLNNPTGIANGDRLLHMVGMGAGHGVTTNPPTGYTDVEEFTDANSGYHIFYRNCDGSEGSTVSYTTANSTKLSGLVSRVTGHDPAVAPQVGTRVVASATNPNPPSVTVTGGPKDVLVFAFATESTAAVASMTSPTNYSTATTTQTTGGGAATNVRAGYGSRGLTNNTTEDPGTFTAATATWSAQTIVIPAVGVLDATQTHFRVRSDDSIALNTDSGWAGALDANVTIDAETVFRLRIELETAANLGAKTYKLQYRRNGGTWTDVARPDPTTAATAVQIVDSAQFADNAATTNILAGSAKTFVAGAGIDADNLSPSVTLNNQHTEFEWPLRMRISYGDAPTFSTTGRNADGDTFEFRIVDSAGTAPSTGSQVIPTVTLNIPNGLLGGTIIETPHRIGPFCDSNGNLYYMHEYGDVAPWLLIVKSTDGGDQWTAPDRTNGALTRDQECVSVQQVGDTLHILLNGGTTPAIYYHTFRMSDHATNPDTWGIKDEVAHTFGTPPQDQSCAIVVRGDGTVVAIYNTDPSGASEQIGYRIRSSGGVWGAQTILDSEATDFTDVVAILGASNKAHIFYVDLSNGLVYHRSLTSANVLSAREQVASGLDTGTSREHPLLPAVYYDDGGAETIVVGYSKSGDIIATNSVINDGTPGTEQTASGVAAAANVGASDHPAAHIAKDGTDVWLFYADASSQDIWRDKNPDLAGWGTDIELLDSVTCDLLTAEIYTHNVGNGGLKVAGIVFDNGSGGSIGTLTYIEFEIPAGVTTHQRFPGDVETLADARTLVKTMSRPQADVEALADVRTQVSSHRRSSAEVETLADAMTFSKVYPRSFNDVETLADIRTQASSHRRSAADVETLADSAVRVATTRRSFADAEALADVISYIKLQSRSVADAVQLLDIISKISSHRRTVGDAEGLSDSMSRIATFRRSLADLEAMADSSSYVKAQTRLISDALALADVRTQVSTHRRPQADTETLSDSITRISTWRRTLAEVETLADLMTPVKLQTRNVADLETLADTFSRSAITRRSFSEAETLSDVMNYAGTGFISRNVNDLLSLSDSVTTIRSLVRVISDAENISDVLSYVEHQLHQRSVSDAIVLLDSMVEDVIVRRSFSDLERLADLMTFIGPPPAFGPMIAVFTDATPEAVLEDATPTARILDATPEAEWL